MDATMIPPLLLILLGMSVGVPLGWSMRSTKADHDAREADKALARRLRREEL